MSVALVVSGAEQAAGVAVYGSAVVADAFSSGASGSLTIANGHTLVPTVPDLAYQFGVAPGKTSPLVLTSTDASGNTATIQSFDPAGSTSGNITLSAVAVAGTGSNVVLGSGPITALGTAGTQAGWLKCYMGTSDYYIPLYPAPT